MTNCGGSIRFALRQYPPQPTKLFNPSPQTPYTMTIRDLLTDLANPGKPAKYSDILRFSGMTADGTEEFDAGWQMLSADRRREVVHKLVELADDNIEFDFTSVFEACLGDEDDSVRELGAKGLWETEDRALIRPLIDLLENDRSNKVRASAAVSLKSFTAMAQDGKIIHRDGERMRRALLNAAHESEEDIEVRRRAIEAVASFNTPETNAAVREAYRSDAPLLVQSALYAMGQSSNAEWLPTVIEETANPAAAIRYEAATACGLLGKEAVTPHLLRLLDDDDSEVRMASIKSLGLIGGPLAKQALERQIADGDDDIERAARDALTSIEFDDDPLGFRFPT